MQEQDAVIEYPLDSLTRTTRFIAGVAPKAMTRVGLGITLAIDDAANDSAGELLGAKLGQGAQALASTAGFVAKTSVSKAVKVSAFVRSTIASEDNPIDRVPAIKGARKFMGQAISEIGGAWRNAGHVTIQVAAGSPVEESSTVEPVSLLPGTEAVIESVNSISIEEGGQS